MKPTRSSRLIDVGGAVPAFTTADVEVGGGDLIHELIEGDLFVSPPVTPFLDASIGDLAATLKEGLAGYHATVATDVPVLFTERTGLVPDVAVWEGERSEDRIPSLIVELRTESTDRYALGPKRVVYSRARVTEYWFVDPAPRLVHVMRNDPELPDYRWPPDVYKPGDRIHPVAFPNAGIDVSKLLGAVRSRY